MTNTVDLFFHQRKKNLTHPNPERLSHSQMFIVLIWDLGLFVVSRLANRPPPPSQILANTASLSTVEARKHKMSLKKTSSASWKKGRGKKKAEDLWEFQSLSNYFNEPTARDERSRLLLICLFRCTIFVPATTTRTRLSPPPLPHLSYFTPSWEAAMSAIGGRQSRKLGFERHFSYIPLIFFFLPSSHLHMKKKKK